MEKYIIIDKPITEEELYKIFKVPRRRLSDFAFKLLNKNYRRIFAYNGNFIIGASENNYEFSISWFFRCHSHYKQIRLDKIIKYNKELP